MTTIIIKDDSIQAKQLIEYLKTLPFAKVVEDEKMSFEEAVEACEAITVDEYFDELDKRIKAHFNNA